MSQGERILILGGGGMVGIQVAREAARELEPAKIIISALTAPEVDEAVAQLRDEAKKEKWDVEVVAAPGDVFLASDLQGKPRGELTRDPKLFDELFRDIFAPDADAYANSFLRKMLKGY
ncbi:MAG TPA: hypothetical protein VGE86_04430, partial [Thermoanaerobaculia bacterium]